MLQILVLGPPAILCDGKPLVIQRRQLRTLIFFLACQSGGVGRGELLNRFWPDTLEPDARRQLRELLSKLRSQLPSPDDLQTDNDRVWLNHETVQTDIQEFLKLIHPVRSILDTSIGNPSLSKSAVTALEEAVSLWRSPNFLSGVRISNTHEFDNWMQEKASTLEYYRLKSLELLANHFSIIGDVDRAILYINRALETDALNDALQTQLISLLYNAGRISEAQSYYAYLRDLYKRELDSDPPEFVKFAKEDISRSLFDDHIRVQPLENVNKPMNPHVFVGRVAELEKMEKAYSEGTFILVSGEIGSGKTRLVQQFYNSLIEKPRLLLITCQEEDSALPLQPLIRVLRNELSHEALESFDPRWLKPLSVLIPDIVGKTGQNHVGFEIASNEGRKELFEVLYQLFRTFSRDSRTLIVLDDIQWCDMDTLEALMYIIHKEYFKDHGFLIFSTRTEIINPKVHDLLFEQKDHLKLPRIKLGPLLKKDMVQLMELTTGQVPADNLIDRMYRATGGNPLFIHETLNAILNTSPDLLAFESENLPLGKYLSDIFIEKENNLTAPAREVLSVAAVYGMDFQFGVLEQIPILDPIDLLKSLEELEEKHFIHPVKNGGNPGQYAFNHSLIRDSLVSRLSPARLCYLHEKIADALSLHKGSPTNKQSSSIARHYDAAGKPILAFRYWVKAGQYARRLFSVHEAYNAFEKANSIRINYGQDIQTSDLYELFSIWGDLAFNLMDVNALRESYEGMYESGMLVNNPLLIGAGLSGMALAMIFSLEIEKAVTMLEYSIQILDTTDNQYEKIQARSRLGMALSTRLQNDKAIKLYAKAIDLGKDESNPMIRQAVITVQYQLAVLYCLMGWPEKARLTGQQGLRNAFLLISHPTAQSNIHLCLAMAAYYGGQFVEAENQVRLCLKSTESLPNPRTSSLAQIIQARIFYHMGRYDKAWELATHVLGIATEKGYYENISEAHCVRGDVYFGIKDFKSAIEEYSFGSEQMMGTFPGLNCLYRMGYSLTRMGEITKGSEILEKCVSITREAKFAAICLPARHLQACLLDEMGEVDEARKIDEEVFRLAAERKISLAIFPETNEQRKLIFDSMDNNMAEITFGNLIHIHGIRPGPWIDIFISKLEAVQIGDNPFDKQRFILFMTKLKQVSDPESPVLS